MVEHFWARITRKFRQAKRSPAISNVVTSSQALEEAQNKTQSPQGKTKNLQCSKTCAIRNSTQFCFHVQRKICGGKVSFASREGQTWFSGLGPSTDQIPWWAPCILSWHQLRSSELPLSSVHVTHERILLVWKWFKTWVTPLSIFEQRTPHIVQEILTGRWPLIKSLKQSHKHFPNHRNGSTL